MKKLLVFLVDLLIIEIILVTILFVSSRLGSCGENSNPDINSLKNHKISNIDTASIERNLYQRGYGNALQKIKAVIFDKRPMTLGAKEMTAAENGITVNTDWYFWYTMFDDWKFAGAHPSWGLFDSMDPAINEQQIRDAQYYLGDDSIILIVWNGKANGRWMEERIDEFLKVKDQLGCQMKIGFLWGATPDIGGYIFESDGKIDFSLPENQISFANDINHLQDKYLNRPDIYRVNGKFVLYNWVSQIKNFSYAKKIAEAICPPGIYYVDGENIFTPPDPNNTYSEIDERLFASDAVMAYLCYSTDLIKKHGTLNEGYIYDLMLVQMQWIDYIRRNAPWVEYVPVVTFNFDDTHLLDRQDANGNPMHPAMFSTPESRVLLMRATIALVNEMGLQRHIRVGTWSEFWEGSAIADSTEYGKNLLQTVKTELGK